MQLRAFLVSFSSFFATRSLVSHDSLHSRSTRFLVCLLETKPTAVNPRFPEMEWLAIVGILLLLFLWRYVRGVCGVRDFWSVVYRDGERVDVWNRFIRCCCRAEARHRAKRKGRGAKPLFHSPHRKGHPDHYYHYHAGNHELFWEGGRFVNYHWIFSDKNHPPGGRGSGNKQRGSRRRG